MRSLLRHGADRRALRAFAERQELVAAGLTRRDLVKLGLMTGGAYGAGMIVTDARLPRDLRLASALGALPPMKPFVEPLPILPVLPARAMSELSPTPTADPNRATNPDTNLPYEG